MNPQLSCSEPNFGAFVAIDWADQKHVWSLEPAGSENREHGEIPHTASASDAGQARCTKEKLGAAETTTQPYFSGWLERG